MFIYCIYLQVGGNYFQLYLLCFYYLPFISRYLAMTKLVSLQFEKYHYNVHHVAIEGIKSLIEHILSKLLSTLVTLCLKMVSSKSCIIILYVCHL